MPTPNWVAKWRGGQVHQTAKGQNHYVLRRQISGHRFILTLGPLSEAEALAELALFERDPFAYRTPRQHALARAEAQRQAEEARVDLSRDLTDRYLAHLTQTGRTPRHVRDCRRYLDWWLAHLGPIDARQISLRDLRRCLGQAQTARRKRIAAWKGFCTFLREELALLPRAQDTSLDLHAPPPRPEKALREKGYTIEHVENFYRAMSPWVSSRPGWSLKTPDVQSVRDCLLLHAKTGLHQTEVDRLARGEGRIREVQHPEIAGTITFLHKSGYQHVLSLDPQGLRAAVRLQARGLAPAESYIRKVVLRTARLSGLPPIRFGELRHSFATWARTWGELVRPQTMGVLVEEVAAVLGHTSPRTTRLHYDGTKVPPLIKLPLNLHHPDDPPLPGQLRLAR